MKNEFDAHRLDVQAFARAAGEMSDSQSLSDFGRLGAEATTLQGVTVGWSARGEERARAGGADEIWLHLQAQVALPMICQRCMGPATVDLVVQRSFRFVADEATAAALDDESEEDVLVVSREFDLLGLVEDELLMAMPLVPRHEQCPTEVPMEASDEDFEAESARKANPFAALANLRLKKPD